MENKSKSNIILYILLCILIILCGLILFLLVKNNNSKEDTQDVKTTDETKLLDIKKLDDYLKIVNANKSEYDGIRSFNILRLDNSLVPISYDCDNNKNKEVSRKFGTANVKYTCNLIEPTEEDLQDPDYYNQYKIEGIINNKYKFEDGIFNISGGSIVNYVSKDNILEFRWSNGGTENITIYDNDANELLKKTNLNYYLKTSEESEEYYAPAILKDGVVYYIHDNEENENEKTTCHLSYFDMNGDKKEKDITTFDCMSSMK